MLRECRSFLKENGEAWQERKTKEVERIKEVIKLVLYQCMMVEPMMMVE